MTQPLICMLKPCSFTFAFWFLIPNKMHFTPVSADSQSFIRGVNELDPLPPHTHTHSKHTHTHAC